MMGATNPTPSPAQLTAWRRLWELLLRPRPDVAEPARPQQANGGTAGGNSPRRSHRRNDS